jgi:alkylation response protein AidB-like acyl-CoA dehydrogenase
MTFELSPDQQAVREQARVFASETVQRQAADIDRTATVPAELLRESAALLSGRDAVATAVAVEEIAVVSGTVALAAAIPAAKPTTSLDLSGLRGAVLPAASVRAQLVLASVALGLGRAAIDTALAVIREANANPGKDEEKPHWVVADAATELQAARLLTLSAAQAIDAGGGETEVAMGRLMASAAARIAVEAALRVSGPAGLREGTLLERLSRDVRAAALLMGNEEQQRATAADGLLPQ